MNEISFRGVFLSCQENGLIGFCFDFSDFLLVDIVDSVQLGLELGVFVADVLIFLGEEGSLFLVIDFEFHEFVLFFREFSFKVFDESEVLLFFGVVLILGFLEDIFGFFEIVGQSIFVVGEGHVAFFKLTVIKLKGLVFGGELYFLKLVGFGELLIFFVEFLLFFIEESFEVGELVFEVLNLLVSEIDDVSELLVFVFEGLLSNGGLFFEEGHFFLKIFDLLSVFGFVLFDHLIEFPLSSFLFAVIVSLHFLSLLFVGDSELDHAFLVSLLGLFLVSFVFLLDLFNLLLKVDNFIFQ